MDLFISRRFLSLFVFKKDVSTTTITETQVYDALRKCMDPEIPVNIVDLGLIYGVSVNERNNVDIKMTMTTRGCPLHNTLVNDVKRNVGRLNGIGEINVEIVWDPPWSIEKMNPDTREKLGFGKPSLRFQIDYDNDKPRKIGKSSKQEDGSLVLMNDDNQGFMVNDAIINFWQSCDGTKTVNQLTDQFSNQLRIPRDQVEQEVVQLIQQLHEAKLITTLQVE